jgi:hypothetical protein
MIRVTKTSLRDAAARARPPACNPYIHRPPPRVCCCRTLALRCGGAPRWSTRPSQQHPPLPPCFFLRQAHSVTITRMEGSNAVTHRQVEEMARQAWRSHSARRARAARRNRSGSSTSKQWRTPSVSRRRLRSSESARASVAAIACPLSRARRLSSLLWTTGRSMRCYGVELRRESLDVPGAWWRTRRAAFPGGRLQPAQPWKRRASFA